jgi:hypothetical protein
VYTYLYLNLMRALYHVVRCRTCSDSILSSSALLVGLVSHTCMHASIMSTRDIYVMTANHICVSVTSEPIDR